jgi:RNA polymerase sigma-70 factor (ECF subfamily)
MPGRKSRYFPGNPGDGLDSHGGTDDFALISGNSTQTRTSIFLRLSLMNKSLANSDDQSLILRTIGGEINAFGLLVQKYQNRLFNGLVQIIQNHAEAEDLTQETFVLAFTKLTSFQGNSAFYTWLYRIAYNLAITRIRRRKVNVSLDSQREAGIDYASKNCSPSERLEQNEQVNLVRTALNQLSEEHRTILILREMEEMDYDALSEILDLPIGTVRSRLHRAREQLREKMTSLIKEPNQSPP